jgi:hypothetical protein
MRGSGSKEAQETAAGQGIVVVLETAEALEIVAA